MVKLTPDLIQLAFQYINPVKDRELDLRGYKIPVIENLGATLDQFDTLDFSDNDIRKLDGFPLLKRLKCLLLNNNRIVRIGEHLEQNLPNLETLVLSGNMIQDLGDIDPLATLPKLGVLSLLSCPVVTKPYYRLYVAFKLTSIRLLDFRKIKTKERDEAITLFKSARGREIQKEIAKRAKTFIPGGIPEAAGAAKKQQGPSKSELLKIRQAIAKATTLEEVERLNKLLQSAQFSLKEKIPSSNKRKNGEAESEEEEEEEEKMEE